MPPANAGVSSASAIRFIPCRGVICLGYPFHPPGRPDKLRTGHLERLKRLSGTPSVRGSKSRDIRCRPVSNRAGCLAAITARFPGNASGYAAADNRDAAAAAIVRLVPDRS